MQMGVFMKKIRDYPFLIIMVILILGISFINFAKKDTEFSEMENRFLAQKPDLTFENVLDTSFGTQYETYSFLFEINGLAERRLQKLFWANKKITALSKVKMDTCLISN